MRDSQIFRDLLFSLSAATAAGIVAIVATGPVFAGAEPAWIAESVAGAIVATAWMVSGLLVVRSYQVPAGVVIYCLGAGAAWFLTRGVVHSTSAYYGLVPFIVACVGGAMAWLLVRRRGSTGLEKKLAVLVPATVIAIGVSSALLAAPVGFTRRVSTSESSGRRLPVVMAQPAHADSLYVWSPRHLDVRRGGESVVGIETDPGSGSARYAIDEVNDSRDIARACRAFQQQRAFVIDHEIRDGAIPSLARRIPVRYRSCHGGRVWIARRDVG